MYKYIPLGMSLAATVMLVSCSAGRQCGSRGSGEALMGVHSGAAAPERGLATGGYPPAFLWRHTAQVDAVRAQAPDWLPLFVLPCRCRACSACTWASVSAGAGCADGGCGQPRVTVGFAKAQVGYKAGACLKPGRRYLLGGRRPVDVPVGCHCTHATHTRTSTQLAMPTSQAADPHKLPAVPAADKKE